MGPPPVPDVRLLQQAHEVDVGVLEGLVVPPQHPRQRLAEHEVAFKPPPAAHRLAARDLHEVVEGFRGIGEMERI